MCQQPIHASAVAPWGSRLLPNQLLCWLCSLAACAMALVVPASAEVTVYFEQAGTNVVARWSGTLNIDPLLANDTVIDSVNSFGSEDITSMRQLYHLNQSVALGHYDGNPLGNYVDLTQIPVLVERPGETLASFGFNNRLLLWNDIHITGGSVGAVSQLTFLPERDVITFSNQTLSSMGVDNFSNTLAWTALTTGDTIRYQTGSPTPAPAAVTIYFEQDGPDVKISASGTINVQSTVPAGPSGGNAAFLMPIGDTVYPQGAIFRSAGGQENHYRVQGAGVVNINATLPNRANDTSPAGLGSFGFFGGDLYFNASDVSGGDLVNGVTQVTYSPTKHYWILENYTLAFFGADNLQNTLAWTANGTEDSIRLQTGSPAVAPAAAVEVVFTDDGTTTTASFSGSVDTSQLLAPDTTSVSQPTPYIRPSTGLFGKGGGVTRWASSITFTRTSGGAGDPLGFGSAVGGAGAPLQQSGDPFLFNAVQGRFELPQNYVSGTAISGQVVFPGMTVADLGVVDTDYTITGGQIIRISSDYLAPPAPDPTLEIGSATTTQSGVVTLPITLTGNGDEFAISGSVSFDPAVFSNPQFTVGAGAPASASLTQNITDAANGNVGFLLGLAFGETFADGSSVVLDLQLTVNAQASKTTHTVTFGDSPSPRGVVNDLAENITATWTEGSVNVINRNPVATDDQETTDEDTTLTVPAPGVLSNDFDPDFGDVLTVVAVSATTPGGASVSISPNGSISYDPTGSSTLNALPFGTGFNDTIDYTIDDGDGGSDIGTLQVTVAGVNDAPTAANDVNIASTDENVTLTVPAAGVLSNDSDPDTGDTLSVASVDATSAHGATVTLNGDGSIGYDSTAAPALLALADGVDLVDSFTYTVEDNLGLQSSATISLTVSGVEFEGDVTPRTSGNNTIDVTDAVMMRRFVVGLETLSAGEFSRVDTAPRSTGGDGNLTVGDFVQTLRYAVGLDPVRRVAGPTAPAGPMVAAQVEAQVEVAPGSALISMDPILGQDGNVALSISMKSTGQVSALGFSVAFDPEIYRYDAYSLATTTRGKTALINAQQADKGRLGVVIANNNVDETFKDGKVSLLNLNLTTISKSQINSSIIRFEDFPASKSVSDTSANKVVTEYIVSPLSTSMPDASTVPQEWLNSYFTLADLSDTDKEATIWGADADPDGDGQPNSMEYAAGTSPIDSKSTFASLIDMRGDSITVSFYPYNEARGYRLLRSDLEDSSEWTEVSSENWQPSTDASLGEGRRTTIKTNGKAGFYRVQVSHTNP